MGNFKDRIETIRSLMRKVGFNRIQDLADEMQLKPNTLTSNIRYLVKKENYNTTFAKKLIHVLEVPKDEFIVALENKQNDDDVSSLTMIENRSNYFSDIHDSYKGEITQLMDGLKAGDTYTLVTTENPWEFKEIEVRKTILKAISSGVYFQYIYPKVTIETQKQFRIFENNIEWETLKQTHEVYLKKMVQNAKEDDNFKDISSFKANPNKFLRRHIKSYFTDNILLTHPMFKFMLVETQIYGGDKNFAFAEAVVGDSFTKKNWGEKSFWYPVANNHAIILRNSIHEEIEKSRL